MPSAPFACLLVLALLGESYRRLRATRRLWQLAAPFLDEPGPRVPGAARVWVAELNEATIELGGGLERAGAGARACARVALALGALGALLDGAAVLRGAPAPLTAPLLSFAVGCVGALGCAWLGRVAEGEAQRLRGAWDALIRQSTRDVAS